MPESTITNIDTPEDLHDMRTFLERIVARDPAQVQYAVVRPVTLFGQEAVDAIMTDLAAEPSTAVVLSKTTP